MSILISGFSNVTLLVITGQVEPDAKIVRYEIDMTRVVSRRLFMGIGDASVFVDDQEIYTMKDLKVGLFT